MQKILIPDDVHKELKVEAAIRGWTIQAAATYALIKWMEQLDRNRERRAGNGVKS